jgi:sugar fermentation stimulation protein A
MEFPQPLVQGTLIKRYKRFLADVRLSSGEVVTAHVANTGAMIGLTEVKSEVWLSPAQNPARKLRWSWELIRVGKSLVGINTQHPNGIVAEAITNGQIPELMGYDSLQREVRYGESSRIDILLAKENGDRCFVEIKNVHLKRDKDAEFPDSVTVRGTKHLKELSTMVTLGHRAAMLYLVQREDCTAFKIAGDIDPIYEKAFNSARINGVECFCYSCRLTTKSIHIGKSLQIIG